MVGALLVSGAAHALGMTEVVPPFSLSSSPLQTGSRIILMSYALRIDVAFVVTCQITRILFVLSCLPPLLPLFGGRAVGPPATTN
jgi:uncharacterized membrane protein AbrB (regulator of aidB expression)